MSSSFLGFIVEILVAVLLLATIAYCIIVNRKLDKLKKDQESLKVIIRDLNQSTLHAEAATSELRATVDKASKNLNDQINRAESTTKSLRRHNDKADNVITKLKAYEQAVQEKVEPRNIHSSLNNEFPDLTPRNEPYSPVENVEPPQSQKIEDIENYKPINNTNPVTWPKLSLSALSSQDKTREEQDKTFTSPQPKRSRFQWDQ